MIIGSKAENIIKQIILMIAFIICTICCIGSVTENIRLDINEKIYFLESNVLVTLFTITVSMIVTFMLFLVFRRIRLSSTIVFAITFAVEMAWILSAHIIPDSDAEYCVRIAAELKDGIYYSLESGEYLDFARVNAFYCIYLMVITCIVGSYNYIFIQIVNALFMSIAISQIYRVVGERKQIIANVMFSFFILYFPIWMQVTFCYGNTIGTSFALLALCFLYDYYKCHSLKAGLLCALYIALACNIKGISYIFLMAMSVIVVLNLFSVEKKKWLKDFIMIAMITTVLTIMISKITLSGLDMISGGKINISGGEPTLARIAMGLDLRKDDGSRSNLGWYTGYNAKTYLDNECNKALTKKKVLTDINLELNEALNHPKEFLTLIIKKNQTIWNEPTFGTFYRSSIMMNNSDVKDSYIYDLIINETGNANKWINRFLRSFQFIIYFGVLLYVISRIIKGDKEAMHPIELIGIVSFIGAFLFFTAWEAKSEYVLSFFIVLITYAMEGYFSFLRQIRDNTILGIREEFRVKIPVMTVSFIAIMVAYMFFNEKYNDDELYQAYLDEHTYVREGNYSLAHYSEKSQDAMIDNLYIDVNFNDFSVRFFDNTDRRYNQFLNWDDIDLDAYPRLTAQNINQVAFCTEDEINEISSDEWRLVKQGDGYVIKLWRDQNKVLSYCPEDGSVKLSDYQQDNKNQVWSFIK